MNKIPLIQWKQPGCVTSEPVLWKYMFKTDIISILNIQNNSEQEDGVSPSARDTSTCVTFLASWPTLVPAFKTFSSKCPWDIVTFPFLH